MADSVPRDQVDEQRVVETTDGNEHGVACADGSNEASVRLAAPRAGEDDGDQVVEMVLMPADDDGSVGQAAMAVATGDGARTDSAATTEDVVNGETASYGEAAVTDVEGVVAAHEDEAGDNSPDTESRMARQPVLAQVLEGMNERDGEKAQLYVATVRPAMTALRYASTRSLHAVENLVEAAVGGVLQSGEGDTPQLEEPGDDAVDATAVTATHGDDATSNSDELAAELGELLDEAAVTRLGNITNVRAVLRHNKKLAKMARARRAERRRASEPTGGEVAMVVEELDASERRKRQQQTEAAYRELYERQEQRRLEAPSRSRRNGRCAQASLVQLDQVPGDIEAAATDGLPTAAMLINGERHGVKLDSGARYSIAGTKWMMRGERLRKEPPVDFVQGIGGFLLDVLGVWAFKMYNTYGQVVLVEACIVDTVSMSFSWELTSCAGIKP